MILNLKITHALELTPAEFILVIRALRGVLRGDEKQAAEALQLAMMKAKTGAVEQMARMNEERKALFGATGDNMTPTHKPVRDAATALLELDAEQREDNLDNPEFPAA